MGPLERSKAEAMIRGIRLSKLLSLNEFKTKRAKGDVKFFENENGKLLQQIKDGGVFPVKDGSIVYKQIKK